MFILICSNCGKEFRCNYSKRKFCTLSCSTSFSNRHRGSHKNETRLKIGISNKGKLAGDKNPAKRPEVKSKISMKLMGHTSPMKGKKQSPESNIKRIIALSGKPKTEEHKKRLHLVNLGRVPITKDGIPICSLNKGVPKSLKHIETMRQNALKQWDNPKYREYMSHIARENTLRLLKNPEYVKKVLEGLHIRPTKPELLIQSLLDSMYPNQWKYVGDGKDEEFIFGRKCPDFANIFNKDKLIEHFGDYWHRDENPQDRIDYFKDYGLGCLVIWEHELKNDLNEVIDKIKLFMGE